MRVIVYARRPFGAEHVGDPRVDLLFEGGGRPFQILLPDRLAFFYVPVGMAGDQSQFELRLVDRQCGYI